MDSQLVKTLQHEIEVRGSELADSFYQRLFAESPQLATVFRNTNLVEQKRRLIEGLEQTLVWFDQPEKLEPYLEDLGVRHVAYEVEAQHYPLVQVVMEKALDDFLPHHKSAWKALAQHITHSMLSGIHHLWECRSHG